MHKHFKLMLALIIGLFTVPMLSSTAFAQSVGNIADGDYDIGVTAMEDGSDKVSVANDFVHDASLTIESGNPVLTLGIGAGGGDYSDFDFSINWVQVDGQAPTGKSDEGNLTYFTFQLNNLNTVVPAQMEYVVPDFPALSDGHEVAFDLELQGLDDLPEKGSEEGSGAPENSNGNNNDNDTGGTNENVENGNETAEGNGDSGNAEGNKNNSNSTAGDNENQTTNGEQETNPQTGESSNIGLYAILLIGALIPLAVQLKRRFS